MTDADLAVFSDGLHRLGRAFGKSVDGELTRDYFDDLRGYSWPLIERALVTVRQKARFWPRPVVILDACMEAARYDAHRGSGVPANVNHDEGRYACEVCEDSGFERALTCPGTGVCSLKGCGVQGASRKPHPFTRHCRCRATNPVLVNERASAKRPAEGVSA